MTDSMVPRSGRQVIKMVWIVTLLGFGVGVFMLAIIYWTLSRIHAEREILSAFQVEMARMVTTLDTHLDQGREDIEALLNLGAKASEEQQWIEDLFNRIAHYSKLSDNEDIQQALNALQDVLQQLQATRRDCLIYYSETNHLLEGLPQANIGVGWTLNQMRNAISRIEGRQRLQRAVSIRKYRQASPEQGNELGRKIIMDVGQRGDIFTIKTEIADLALLCERLRAEDQIDNLADLKDNKFKPTLDRLRRGISMFSIRHGWPNELPVRLLDLFESKLFGDGFHIDAVHQTILPGHDGLFPLIRQRLVLKIQREQLQAAAEGLFSQTRKIRQKLVFAADALAEGTARSAEQVLKTSWQTMLWVWLLSTTIFLMLSSRIAQTAKRQINAIETANTNLQSEVQERLRIENVLLKNRRALRQAKGDLEIRVDERTREIQQTNEQLGREVSIRKRTEEQLRQRGQELTAALTTARKARRIAETERDRSEKVLAQVTESNRRLEILISDATTREKRMVALKREINDLRRQLGMEP
ncbi:MAG: hypothetical protein P8X55_14600, partial [Desulfosarcinaceae bacterium]